MDRFVIRARISRRNCVASLVVFAFVLLLTWLLFTNAILDLKFLGGDSEDVSTKDLLNENAELREKLLILEQNIQMDNRAAVLLQEQLIYSQGENSQLRKDLEFYQGIINATDEANSPVMHGIRIKPLTRLNGYRFELILLNIANTDKMIEGVVDVVLEGILDSALKRLSLTDLSLDENQIYSIRFRNFQRFENNFILPENFKPQRVFVTLSISDRKNLGFEKVFDWSVSQRRTANVG